MRRVRVPREEHRHAIPRLALTRHGLSLHAEHRLVPSRFAGLHRADGLHAGDLHAVRGLRSVRPASVHGRGHPIGNVPRGDDPRAVRARVGLSWLRPRAKRTRRRPDEHRVGVPHGATRGARSAHARAALPVVAVSEHRAARRAAVSTDRDPTRLPDYSSRQRGGLVRGAARARLVWQRVAPAAWCSPDVPARASLQHPGLRRARPNDLACFLRSYECVVPA